MTRGGGSPCQDPNVDVSDTNGRQRTGRGYVVSAADWTKCMRLHGCNDLLAYSYFIHLSC